MHLRSLPAAAAGALLLTAALAPAQSDTEIVKKWLATNAGLETLRVDFTQTRKLTSLKAPLSENGTLWMDYRSGRFRWEMGNPPETIVLREDRDLLIVRPRERKFERREPGKDDAPGLAALAKGFPRNLTEFQRKFRLHEIKAKGDTQRIVALPLDRSARGVATITFVVGAERYRLRAVEIVFRDGSTQHMVFTKVVPEAPLPPGLFELDLSGYEATTF